MASSPNKVFVFGLPRSGSTLLCDLLTIPGRSVVLHEPMILRRFGDGRERRICDALAETGILVHLDQNDCIPGTPARPWYEQRVLPQLTELEFWGLKEVYLTDALQLIDIYRPDKVILLWRDPRDVAPVDAGTDESGSDGLPRSGNTQRRQPGQWSAFARRQACWRGFRKQRPR